MSAEIDIAIGPARVDPLPVLVTAVDVTLLTGPARLIGWSLREASADAATDHSGFITSPAANQQIVASGTLAAGTYDIRWTVSLEGTLAAGDADNFRLIANAVPVETSQNLAVAGEYPQTLARVTLAAAGPVAIQAFVIGTVGAVYGAQIEAVPVVEGSAVAEIQDGNQPLAEISIGAKGSDTHTMPYGGIHVRGQLLLHVVSGTVTGVVYAITEPY